jgi:translation initiation factor 1A
LWLREGDVLLVEPWEFDNEKGDVIFKYTPAMIFKLKSMGKLETKEDEF